MRFGSLELDFSVVGEIEMYEPVGELEEGKVVVGEVPEELRKLFSLVVALNQRSNKTAVEGLTEIIKSVDFLCQSLSKKKMPSNEYLEEEARKIRDSRLELEESELKTGIFGDLFWLALASHLNLPVGSGDLAIIENWKVVARA
jgi:hypothetical protein